MTNSQSISHRAVLIFARIEFKIEFKSALMSPSYDFANVKGVKPIKNVKYSVVFIADHAFLMRRKLQTLTQK